MVTINQPPPQTITPDRELAEQAVERAAEMLRAAQAVQTPFEKAQSRKIAGMMNDPNGKTLTLQLSDQAFRSSNNGRIANQIQHLLVRYGVPQYFAWWERAALAIGAQVGQILPDLVVPFIVAKVRQETQSVILPGEEKQMLAYFANRRFGGTRLNINQLGEAILGEGEASRRLDAYLKLLARPEVEYISVKISSVFSQIHLVAFDETVEAIKDRLRLLYRQAMAHPYQQPDGTRVPKFVNLDMEEYRDLHLTVAAFQQVLDEPEFHTLRAGIVLQAYLPDSSPVQHQLTEWAMQRFANGGASIKLRIVKGANLAMEQVESASHGWALAPYGSKHEVDANYKRMVTYGSQPERAQAVNLGIASHNLFDLCYALLLRDKYGIHDYIEFEMLEGMANHQARVIQDRADGLLLYAPVVKRNDFHSAIAYLMRRLDENTAPENFLHDLFSLEVGSPTWEHQRDLFLSAFDDMNKVSMGANRQQNRQTEAITFDPDAPFSNVSDTDWSLPQNQAWVRAILNSYHDKPFEPVPLQIGGTFIGETYSGIGHDPSRPDEVLFRYAQATREQIDQALDVAVRAQSGWASTSIDERKGLLVKAAEQLAARRGDLLGIMAREAGKRVEESDPEISEAIDFANYYARSFDLARTDLADCDFTPLGTVLITPPWNFPLAIPAGGTLAALMAGNTVIFKPAPEATLTGWQIVNALWDAGIPKDVLQFVPTTDDEVGKSLVTDERVNGVILTGAYETAQMFLGWKPEMNLFAETSGKNSMIITAMADRDQAIKDLVKSAFGHAGQKCSASSLAVLEAEVYDDPTFRRQLVDASASLHVGSPFDPQTFLTPVIHAPEGKLERALTTLESGERWLLEPHMVDDNPNLWSPGIKLGVKQGSFYHQTECFGPVLGLMRANNLEHAIDIANDVEYGLTSGIHSLDDREIDIWTNLIEAGNAYVNRGTTGAIVQRQPFGGWKKSAFGYAKAGGPNYTFALGTWHEAPNLTDAARLQRAQESYKQAWVSYFSQEHDPSGLAGEKNVLRYRPLKRVILRVESGDNLTEAEMVAIATRYCSVKLYVSVADGVDVSALRKHPHVMVQVEDEAALIAAIEDQSYAYTQRLRVLSPVSATVRQALIASHVMLADAPVVSSGRLELRHYVQEQSVTHVVHRYGNIMD